MHQSSEIQSNGQVAIPDRFQEMIRLEAITFSYSDAPPSDPPVIENLSLVVQKGTHTAILGSNGSGKSTLARLCNALEIPEKGSVWIDQIEPKTMEAVYQIRRRCGMVFQNPDNQIIGNTVEEDVAFGPENLNKPTEEIRSRVDRALKKVGLSGLEQRTPSSLSGGQKQKLSIAGILAMSPDCIILDEATSMLDPYTAEDFIHFADRLCREQGLTLLSITHDMEQALLADRVIVVSNGSIIAEDPPKRIFSDQKLLSEEGLRLPVYLSIVRALREKHPDSFPAGDFFTEDDWLNLLAGMITRQKKSHHLLTATEKKSATSLSQEQREGTSPIPLSSERNPYSGLQPMIQVTDLGYSYNPDQPSSPQALDSVSFEVYPGEIFALCGHSGSGKSTLITHLNGLFRPQRGQVIVDGKSLADPKQIEFARQKVGLVFQYPEYQLFESTVYRDIAYGPCSLGLSEEEVDRRVSEAMELVGLPHNLAQRSPFELSGGEQRRTAIAGILAMEPEVLVLDEPAAGLDPQGREMILSIISNLKRQGRTILFVTHNMDDAAELADRMGIMVNGRMEAVGTPREIFQLSDLLEKASLLPPHAFQFGQKLSSLTGDQFEFVTEKDAVESLSRHIQKCQEGVAL